MGRLLKSILWTETLPAGTNRKRHSENRKEDFDSQTSLLGKQTEKAAAADMSCRFTARD